MADRPGYMITCSYCGERKHVEHNRRDGGRKRRCCSAECAEARKRKFWLEIGESPDDAYVLRYWPETRALFTDAEWQRLTEVSRAARMGVAPLALEDAA